MFTPHALSRFRGAALVACLVPALGFAQTPGASPVAKVSGYDQPPQNILDIMRAPSPPVPYVSPAHDRILLVSWEDYPSIARVATPFLRLAGVRIEPKNHSKHDTPGGYGITPSSRRDTSLVTCCGTGAACG